MNNQNQIQRPIERFPSYEPLHAGSDEGRGPARPDPVTQALLFGPFCVVPRARLLEREGHPVSLGGRAFDLLCILASRSGEVVSKRELLAKAWPDVAVEEGSLRFHIAQLRRALGDNQGSERYVVNVAGRGYCFVAQVSCETSSPKRGHDDGVTSTRLADETALRSVASGHALSEPGPGMLLS